MKNLFRRKNKAVEDHKPLPAGFFTYHTPPHAELQYRLHLRIEPDGNGLLIVNASTILHLNQTATEFAYYLMQNREVAEIVPLLTERYNAGAEDLEADLINFKKQILALVCTEDQAPSDYAIDSLHDGADPSAPYRLDACLTLRLAGSQAGADLPLEDWQKMLRKAFDAGIPQVVFSGGDPLLYPDFVALLQYCEELGLVTGLVSTNARMAEPKFVDQLISCGLDHYVLDGDFSDESTRQILANVLPRDLFTCLRLPAKSYAELCADLQELKEMGLNAIALNRDDRLSFDEYQSFLEELESKALIFSEGMPEIINVEELAKAPVGGKGPAMSTTLYVLPDGEAHLGHAFGPSLGSLQTDSVEGLWEKRHG